MASGLGIRVLVCGESRLSKTLANWRISDACCFNKLRLPLSVEFRMFATARIYSWGLRVRVMLSFVKKSCDL